MSAKNAIKRYIDSHEVRKLQVGCQYNLLKDWLNTDAVPLTSDVIFLDATKRLPFEDNVFDYIFAEHMIEHINYQQGCLFLSECFRILKVNGKIRLATPDLNCIVNLYNRQTDELGSRYLKFTAESFSHLVHSNYDTFAINQWFYGWGHRFIYDFKTLESCLINAEFGNIARCNIGESNDPFLKGLERHGYMVPPDFNNLETMVVEAQKINSNIVSSKSVIDGRVPWCAAWKLHNIIDRILPLGTRRRLFAQQIVRVAIPHHISPESTRKDITIRS